jgi:hypothetical protein
MSIVAFLLAGLVVLFNFIREEANDWRADR